MPKLPFWYNRIPEILGRLNAPGAPPVLDRPAVEELFAVSRRQAIRLLNLARGYQVGKTFIVERQALIDFLGGLETSGGPREARARKQRVAQALTEVANYVEAQRVQIAAPPDSLRRRAAELPAAIALVAPGRLQISFEGAEDLLARIVELAAAAANDFPAFRERYEARE